MTYAVAQPFSLYAEGIRQLRMALGNGVPGGGRIIGIVAPLPAQGRSTVASNLAHQYAASGVRTVLIDCDLRNPELSENLMQGINEGLADVLTGAVAWQQAAKVDPATGLAMLSGRSMQFNGNPSELLLLATFEELLDQLAHAYDAVILDLAPFGVVSDARAAARLVDAFVLVLARGRVSKQFVSETLAHVPEIQDKIVGVVLNRAEMSADAVAYRQPRKAHTSAPVTGTSLAQHPAH